MKHFFILLFLISVSYQTSAQIVNIENKRKNLQDTSGVFGQIDLGFNIVNNTKQIISTNAAANLTWVKNKTILISITDFGFVSADKDRFVNRGFQHLRYNYQINDRITWEVFTQAQYNEQIRIKWRGLAGTGPRFKIHESEKGKTYLATLYMFENQAFSDTSITRIDHRISSYVSIFYNITKQFSISNTTYIQPVITNFELIRISSATSFSFKITDQLAFRSSFSLIYDSLVPQEVPDVPYTIYELTNGLRWNF